MDRSTSSHKSKAAMVSPWPNSLIPSLNMVKQYGQAVPTHIAFVSIT
jgi:hypothetical protein